LDVPNLIQVQLDSFNWLKTAGLEEVFGEVSPIEDFPNGRFALSFLDHHFEAPKYSEDECRSREITYSAPLHVTVQLETKVSPADGEKKLQDLFIGDIPMMTSTGTFIMNGAERVVVSQLVRSPGVYFTTTNDPVTGRPLASAKLIPYRGAWMEFETSNKDVVSVKVDRKRKSPVSMLLRAMGYTSDDEIKSLFEDVDTDPDHSYISTTIDKDTTVGDHQEALLEFYRRLRPGEPPSIENAKLLLDNLFFNPRRYDLGRVGRYKLNKTLGPPPGDDPEVRTLTPDDIISLLKMMIEINNGVRKADDIDHLGNRRVRAVGELMQNQIRVGLVRMERVIKERMTTQMDPATTTPAALINIRPVVAAVREFFGGSQLSQFMDQTNPLAELTHKRRLSALGPGGLSRERAGFDVRDVHHSHYGRICPIETPEGPNIGLLGSMATYARTNKYGFIETPYRKVHKEILNTDPDILNRVLTEAILDENGEISVKADLPITIRRIKRVAALPEQLIKVKPYVRFDSNDVAYLSADDEEEVHIAQANSVLDDKGQFVDTRVEVRIRENPGMELPANVDYMDVSPMQVVSVSTSLIPFLEHDDANRALMGSNMQRQAVPLIKAQAPLVGTGMEGRVARDSGQVVLSETEGVVIESSGKRIVVMDSTGEEHSYWLKKFVRSNQGTSINQRPVVSQGSSVAPGDVLADSASTSKGDLALGQNTLVAFMSWEGYNYEDAIIVSERLVKDDRFTSIHIEKHEVEARDTKLGPEEVTRDIPNVGEESLRNLDEDGIVRVGAEVSPGDVLVGKITPKGETELSAEEKLLRAIFGEKARDVKDTSLRVPHGERGKVIGIKVLSKANGDELSPGVNRLVRLWIAQTRKVAEGDKMAGRHGNKGVISRILPEEDMPFLPDGTPVDIILNPIGVPSRMNLGQVLETHLGWAAHELGFQAETPVFDGAPDVAIEDALAQAWMVKRSGAVDPRPLETSGDRLINRDVVRNWLSEKGYDYDKIFGHIGTCEASDACLRIWFEDEIGQDCSGKSFEELKSEALRLNRTTTDVAPIFGKSVLHDGRTGEPFDQPITVGYIYMMKLIHLVEDKIHARSTGPYSLITQQPLGGKAQFGGQRFGEMEVWALEAYSAAYNLQEMLTVKSDDVVGRVKTYEAIVKGEDIVQPGIPESFHVLLKELQSLGLSMELLHDESEQGMSDAEQTDDLGIELKAPGIEISENQESPEDGEVESKDLPEEIASINDTPSTNGAAFAGDGVLGEATRNEQPDSGQDHTDANEQMEEVLSPPEIEVPSDLDVSEGGSENEPASETVDDNEQN
jgi:DNA-directed RNA polymerase subunit beta